MKKIITMFAMAAALFVASCGGSNTPSDAVTEIYSLIIDGNYEAVADCFQYNNVKPEELEQAKAMIVSLLSEKMAPKLEKKGGLKAVETLEEVIAEDGQSATVKVKMIYGDGTDETQDVKMVLNDKGEWKATMGK